MANWPPFLLVFVLVFVLVLVRVCGRLFACHVFNGKTLVSRGKASF